MMKAITLRGIFLIVLLIPAIAQAYTETLYVCQGGNGSEPTAGNCSTAFDDSALNNSSYWDTDVAADGRIGPDDLVLFLDDGGAFTSNMNTGSGGLPGQPITFSVAPGDTVTWNGQGRDVIYVDEQYITIDGDDRLTINTADTADFSQGINAQGGDDGSDYLTVQNVIIAGPGSGATYGSTKCIYLRNDHFTITGNDISHCEVGIFVDLVDTGVHYGTISYNNIHDMDQPSDNGAFGGQDCITLKSGNDATRMDMSGVVVSHNSFSNWLDDAIDMYGSYGVTFEYNDVGPNNVSGYSGLECNGIKMAGHMPLSGDGTIVRYNHIHDFSNSCIGQGINSNGNGGGSGSSAAMYVYGNLIENLNAGNESHGIDMVSNEVSGEGNWKIWNNTVTNVQGWALRTSYNQEAGSEIYNNILDGDSGDLYINPNNTHTTNGGYNILVNSGSASGGGSYTGGSIDLGNTDPNFNNPAATEYWLQAGSPAIDAGANLDTSSAKALLPGSAWPTDVVAVDPYMDGTQREIGAFAYGGNGGVSNPVDNCPSDPAKTEPGICGCGVSDADSDSDGIPDCNDSCPSDPGNDVDGDGICAYDDNCPTVSNPSQADNDNDGIGNACDTSNVIDTDGDGVADATDNCPSTANANQSDSDNDGMGNACDTCPNDPNNDIDNDGVCGNVDNCPTVSNPGQADSDGDGIGDACDSSNDTDSDGDGIADENDACPADFNKTEPGFCGCGEHDIDSDNDGVFDCNDGCPFNEFIIEPGADCTLPEDYISPGINIEVTTCAGVTLTFDQVSSGGFVECSWISNTSAYVFKPNSNEATLKAVSSAYDIDFTGTFDGFVTVCFGYDESKVKGQEKNLKLFHYHEGQKRENIATLVDTENNTICGEVTQFSEFGLAEPDAVSDITSGGASSPSGIGCFIATAAYGSYMEPHVMTLRHLRDSYLLTNRLGTSFVHAYYRYSPPIADYIAEHDMLRSAVRVGLTPLVGFSWIAMNYGIMPALLALFFIFVSLLGITGSFILPRIIKN